MLRSATPADAAAIAAIYNHYIVHTVVTFEEEPVPVEEMARRLEETLGGGNPWFVWEEDGRVQGYAYASKWKSRCSYRFSVEATVYLDKDVTGRGIGTKLYTALVEHYRGTPIHAMIGGVSLPNPASQALHEKLGFKQVAHFKEVGWKFGKWIDVGYWELLF